MLKPSHSSGRVLLCRDKSLLDWVDVRRTCEAWLSENYFDFAGEWQYRAIPPRILCEKLIADNPVDYKFFCFHGEPRLINVMWESSGKDYHEEFLDMNFERLQFATQHTEKDALDVPPHFEDMVAIARKLSGDFPFVRVDLYNAGGWIYFGELTFTPANGMDRFEPVEWDYKLGEWLDLSLCKAEYVIKLHDD